MKKLFFTLIFFPIFQFHSQEVVITAVKVIENKIHIEYSLTGADSYELMLWYKKKYDNKWIGPLKQLQGDFGKNTRKGEKKIIWNTLNEVDDFIGEYQFGISFIEKAVIPEPIAEKEIETPTENTTPSQYNYSYSSGFSSFFENISDEFAGLHITPYIAGPYLRNWLLSSTYFNYPYVKTMWAWVPGVKFMCPVASDKFSVGIDMGFTKWRYNYGIGWYNYGLYQIENASYTYKQFRLLARVNWNLSDNVYFGFGFGYKRIKETSVSSNPQYDGTNIRWRTAGRVCLGLRTSQIGWSRFSTEVGFGGGGFMFGYSYCIH